MQRAQFNPVNDASSSIETQHRPSVLAWEEVLQAQSGVNEVAVTLQTVNEPLRYRHLQELLPVDWFPHLKKQAASLATTAALDSAQTTESVANRPPSILEGVPLLLPDDMPETLPEVLRYKAKTVVGEQWIFLDADGCEQRQSYKGFLQSAEQILAGLQTAGLRPQDNVVLQLEHNQDILTAFWACLLGGFIPVIMSPPADYTKANNEVERLVHVYQHLQQPYLLTDSAHYDAVGSLAQWCELNTKRILLLEAIRDQSGVVKLHCGQPDDVAFLTLTSGSTGAPKCIPLTHRNLIHRALGVNQGNAYTADDVILNWLPFDHIGSISDWNIRCVVLGCKLVYAPKEYVLGQPLNWLALIDSYRITHSWAPNFAYSLILNTLREQDTAADDWDLSCVKSLLTAGEAVSPTTVSDFLEGLARFDFPPHAICPAFGMAEMGSGVTYFHARADHPLCFHTLSRASLHSEDGVVTVADDALDAVRFTSLGPPIPGVSLRLVDEQRQSVPMGTVGHFQVKGAAVAAGYYRNPQATAESFLDDGWFDTGDLACFIDGELVICGRAKEVIIINGANYSGAEIEAVAESVTGVSVSFTAACAVNMPGQVSEELALFFVPKPHLKPERILPAIRQTLLEKLGLAPAYLLPLDRDEVPKTAIGKIQRKQLAQRLEAGQFDELLVQVDVLLGNERTVPEWFYQRAWSEHVLSGDITETAGLHAIVRDTAGLAEVLQQRLEACGHTCVVLDHDHDASISLQPLSHALTVPVHVWHLSGYGQETGVDNLLSLMHALSEWNATSESTNAIVMRVVASQAQAVHPDDSFTVEKAIAPALLKSYAAEHPNVVCQHVDLPADSLTNNVQRLLQVSPDENLPEVAWRDNRCYVAGLRQTTLAAPTDTNAPPPICSGGFYLVTGGLGGVGIELATFLLKQYGARLLLTGRSEARGERWQSLQQLAHEASGKVRYVALDVADTEALQHSVQQAEQDWQVTLSGVFHLAGISGERAVAEMSENDLASVLRPKLSGALAIQPLLEKRPQAWVVYSASVVGFFGGSNVAAYAAANACLDALAVKQRQQGFRSYSLGWSMWDNVGMSSGVNTQSISEAMGYCLISPDEAMRSLLVALAQDQPCLLVGLDGSKPHVRHYRVDVQDEAQECVAYCVLDDEQPVESLADIPVRDHQGEPLSCRLEIVDGIPRLSNGEPDFEALLQQVRPDLRNTVKYVAPRTPLETQLTAMWQEVLKKNRVGVLDNFFVLGGASLQAIQCISRINQTLNLDLPPGVLFENPTIEAIAQYIDSCVPSTAMPTITPRIVGAPVQASFSQKRLWFLDEMGAGAAYNMPVALRLRGTLNVDALEKALNCVVQRHEVLRSLFKQEGIELTLVSDVSFQLPIEDLTTFSVSEQEKQVMDYVRADAQQLFDLSADILLRAKLLYLSPSEHVLLLNLHHIAGDGWSVSVLARELKLLYAAYQAGDGNTLPDLTIQYADFAAWQRETLQGERLNELLAFWKKHLEGAPELLQLPTDFTRPEVESYQGAQQVIKIPAALTAELHQLVSGSGATLYMTLLTAFYALLFRYSHQDDLVVVSPIACRNRAELEPLIGFFANTLVLRTRLDDEMSFLQLLEQVRNTAQAAYDHQDVPFEKLVEELNVNRSLAYNPLAQVLFALQSVSLKEFEFNGLHAEPVDLPSEHALFDLELQLWETTDGLEGYFYYKTSLFRSETIERLAGSFLVLLEGIVTAPSMPISRLPLLTDMEKRQLVSLSDTPTEPLVASTTCSTDKTIAELFEQQVRQTPDAVAVSFAGEQLNYKELNTRANRLCHYLLAHAVRDSVNAPLIGICMERSPEMMVALLAVLKTGSAYVPIDPAYPQERIRSMLENSQTHVVLTHSHLQKDLPQNTLPAGAVIVSVDTTDVSSFSTENPIVGNTPDDLGYVIYTSGSTGKPKGVALPQKALTNLLLWQQGVEGLDQPAITLQFTTLSFDVSFQEIFSTWLGGGQLVLVDEDTRRNVKELLAYIALHKVERLFVPFVMLQHLAEAFDPAINDLSSLKNIITAGEQLRITPAIRYLFNVLSHCRLHNHYGPSESHVVTALSLPKDPSVWSELPSIGRPISNNRIYILDQQGQPTPIGIAGELCIAGTNLADGYLHRPDLTDEKFILVDVLGRTERIYKTGDFARWSTDGHLECLGRIDHQVKLRGFRIELGEIESVLAQHPAVQEEVVIVDEADGNKRLIAYVSAIGEPTALAVELKNFLHARLPEYMVPALIQVMAKLPLTPSGKIDRKSLPSPQMFMIPEGDLPQGQLPKGSTECQLAAIWQEVLKIAQVYRENNFFDLGGHSLLATQVVSRINHTFSVDMPLSLLFANATLTDLAETLDKLIEQESLWADVNDEELEEL